MADHDGDTSIPEEVAHRILARAAEIEARDGASVPLARVREVASEAGIAPAAVERAMREVLHPPRSWAGRLTDRLLGWLTSTSPVSTMATVTTNVLAFSAAWLLMGAGARIALQFGDGWVITNGVMILSLLVGLGLAVRVRARLTAILLAITAAALLAEYPLHLIYGIGVVQGAATKWALMLSAGFGIMLSRLLTRKRAPRPADQLPGNAATDTTADSQRQSPPDLTTLRLRIVPR
jgi:hypothetical protein